MMIQSVTKAGKKLFVILILGITLLQSGCNKATKETQQKAEKADGVEEQKKTEVRGLGRSPDNSLWKVS